VALIRAQGDAAALRQRIVTITVLLWSLRLLACVLRITRQQTTTVARCTGVHSKGV